ncbi:hypothetical protein [Xanthomonas sacchari]|uniref:Uncharacterized protein n=1 Tax=Xanthomonas sacchari TaxID=56458 RepID=A0A2P5Z508_9XANT|nr:hypothetical protein [Xanthomonas sacchari]MDV0438274.1 hypothetical protein [Xanthomonas sacchari]PPU83067.1 hypothetical protein XsacCFBP4641_07765 [Xanthomonas sacchari]
MDEQVLVLNCKVSDFDASTGQCAHPFYSVASSFPPPLDAGEGLGISAVIVGAWAIGFMVRQGRRISQS